MAKKNRETNEVNASSMADIAFLLLIFFLVTTTIASDKGILVTLPPVQDIQKIEVHDHNVFKVLINSNDDLLVEENPMYVKDVKDECKKFLSNNGRDPKLSDSPKDAVVSLKANRGTTYNVYIEVLDNLKAAYHELRAEACGISVDRYLLLDKKNPADKKLYDIAKKAYPMQLSEAKPD